MLQSRKSFCSSFRIFHTAHVKGCEDIDLIMYRGALELARSNPYVLEVPGSGVQVASDSNRSDLYYLMRPTMSFCSPGKCANCILRVDVEC